jgi:chemotaxis protein MotB
MGALAGSNGIMGGRSIIDPDGFPYTAKQTGLMERLTPKSEGGPTENDPSPNSENARDNDAKSQNQSPGSGEGEGGGTGTGQGGEKGKMDQMEKDVKEALASNPALEQLQGQVQFVRDKDGLRIEVIDKADFSMFPLGTTKLQSKAQALLGEIAKSLAGMPNKIAVRGHTDATPFRGGERSNWELSAERANAVRRLLLDAGIAEPRLQSVAGHADRMPLLPAEPLAAGNRRVAITLLRAVPAPP